MRAFRCAGLVAVLVASIAPSAAPAQPTAFVQGHATIIARDAKRFPAGVPGAPAPAPAPAPALGSDGARSGAAEHNPPTFAAGFDPVTDSGAVAPPDASGAVGPAHVLTVTAQDVTVHSRTGSALASATLQAWWAGLGATGVFDPHAFYDPYGGRFVFVAASDSGTEASSLLLAVTQTGDAAGAWNRYRIDDKGGTANWADAPVAGFNAQWITIQAGMRRISNGTLGLSRLFMVDKMDAYANGDNRVPYGDLLGLGTAQVPALTYEATLNDHWLLQNWNGNMAGQGTLRLYRLTGPVGEPNLEVRPNVTSYLTWASAPPSGAAILPQAGTATKIHSGDARMRSVVYRGGSVYAAHTVFLPTAAPTRASVQWWEVVTSTGAIRQSGRMDDTTAATMYAYPAIAVNARGDAIVAANRFRATEHPSAVVAFRYGIEPPGTLRTPLVARTGVAQYIRQVGGVNRWGDYATAQVDPVNDDDLWAVQPYAAGPSNRWGVRWSALHPNPAPALEAAPASLVYGYQQVGSQSPSTNVTVTSAGQQPATIASVTLAGPDAADFAIAASSCGGGGPMQPGGTCAVAVRFAPLTTGPKSASLVVASNDPASPDTVALSGVAVPPGPRVTLSPASIEFGNQPTGEPSAPRPVTVTNTGVDTLQPGPIAFQGGNAAHFAVATDSCTGASLAAGESCTVGVAFAPSVTGSLTAQLRVDANTYWSPDFVAVSGIGIPPGGVPGGAFSPANLSFGGVHVGLRSATLQARLVATGTAPLTLGAVRIVGANAGDFAVTNDGCSGATVAPGQWCTIAADFAPHGLANSIATLEVPSNSMSRLHTLALSGTGVDARPPSSEFATADGDVLIGVGVNLVVSTLGVQNAVSGSSIDDLSGVRRVDVTFTGDFETRRVQARIACDPPMTRCTWSAVVPGTPGEYDVSVRATDWYGNVEPLAPTIRILVV